jgi:predicted permease
MWTLSITPLARLLAGRTRTALLVMLGAVGMVLLIACANVSHLLLARSSTQTREMAVRAALGAWRGRLVRQLLVESGFLALLGGAAGVLVAYWGLGAIVAMRPPALDELEVVRLDLPVLGFCLALSLVTALLFGLLPALHATRTGIEHSLRAGAGTAGAAGGRRFRATFIAAEVALSLVLLSGAGLLIRSVYALYRLDPGFAPRGLLATRVELPAWRYKDEAAMGAFLAALLERVRAVPGVGAATLAQGVPPNYGLTFGGIEVEGRAISAADSSAVVATNWVGPDYFRVLGIRLLEGRTFAERGDSDVVIVNRAMARHFWPGGSAVGRRLRWLGDRWMTVIGVAEDVHALGAGSDINRFQIHVPRRPALPQASLIVRGSGDPMALAPALKAAAASLDRDVPLRDLTRVEDALAKSIAGPRFNMALLTAFAGLALLLAAVGLYGVISYAVTQRTREIGIRLALGASHRSVLRYVVASGMLPALLGVAIGLVTSLGATRALRSLLFNLSPHDPLTLATVVALLAAVALAACWIPARRATRVDPMTALRAE